MTQPESCAEAHGPQRPSASATAQRQQTKSGKLRAAMCLTCEWRAPIDGGFTKGVDPADRQEARVLLEELS
jgi:hypothetical protein